MKTWEILTLLMPIVQKMLQDHRTVTSINFMTTANLIMSCFNRLEGKEVDLVDLLARAPKQPQYTMPYNSYGNKSLYAAANQDKLVNSTIETNKANLGGVSTTMPMVMFVPNWLITCELKTDQQ